MAGRMLGKAPPRKDRRTLKLRWLLPKALPPVPAAFDFTGAIMSWGMMKNDSFGDCTCAAVGHLIMEWTAGLGALRIPSDDDILGLYTAVTNPPFNSKTGANDNGAVILDVLNYWRNVGVAGDKIDAFASVDLGDIELAKVAIYIFEGMNVGIQLPISAQTQDVWDVIDGPTSSEGSWGGHSVPVVGYNETGPLYVTWGEVKQATWAFHLKYCDEQYVIIDLSDVVKNGLTRLGFNVDALNDYLSKIGSMLSAAADVVQSVLVVPIGGLGHSEMESVANAFHGRPECSVVKLSGEDEYKVDLAAIVKNNLKPWTKRVELVGHSFAAFTILDALPKLNLPDGVSVDYSLLDPVSDKPFVSHAKLASGFEGSLKKWYRRSDVGPEVWFGIEVPLDITNSPISYDERFRGHNDIPHNSEVIQELLSLVVGA